MRLAIVCSWLNQYGGAERVLEVVHEIYPEAPIFTSIHDPDSLPEAWRAWDIRPSFLNRLPLLRKKPQWLLPLFPHAFESHDLNGYDVVFSLTSAFGHGVITSEQSQHVCYCLTPTRFLWGYHGYIEREGIGRLARLGLPLFLKGLRQWDRAAADRVDRFVSISTTVRRRVKKFYRRDSDIIYPPVRLYQGKPVAMPENYYLIVSRLVPYKRIDLAVRAFNALGWPLRIIGNGRDRRALEAMAAPNITFLGYTSDDEVWEQMARCRAFIFPGEEDFGLTPIEAMSTGRPVIAYRGGGALDTLIEGETGLFFREANAESLIEALERFDESAFDPETIRRHARTYDGTRFRRELAEVLEAAYREASSR